MSEKIILAGGCFWGMEELFREQKGVIDTRVGYTGGTTANPTYNSMKAGGHAEAIELTYDPALTDYKTLLHFFFRVHDSTTPMRQGNDIGSQYRSAIFYLNNEQRQAAEDVIKAFDASRKLPGKIVTEVVPAGEFYAAEEAHQDYLQKHPDGYTCHWVRPNWTL